MVRRWGLQRDDSTDTTPSALRMQDTLEPSSRSHMPHEDIRKKVQVGAHLYLEYGSARRDM